MNVFHTFTRKSLRKNKTRTIVTIIGIILSVAMFTATTEAFFSAREYLAEMTARMDGSFHVTVFDLEKPALDELTKDERIKKSVTLQSLGYAEMENNNDYKPYVYLAGIDSRFADMMPIYITEGRMPEKENEILVSNHLIEDGGVKIKVGQSLKLDVGTCVSDIDGKALYQEHSYDIPSQEKIIDKKEMTFTVVGICERPNYYIEPYSAPGYTLYTTARQGGAYASTVFFTLKNTRNTVKVYDELNKKYNNSELNPDHYVTYNDGLVMLYGASGDTAFLRIFYGLMSILIALIVFGSVALIYNSFSISISERTKQFGLLKSIGATKKQTTKTVLYEAFMLCVIGVPLGLISGCAGIAVTFRLLSDEFLKFLNYSSEFADLKMKFILSPPALILSAVIGILTVLISAYIPARRAKRIDPIEAIRQSKDIKISRRSVKISPLTEKVFGFAGMISSKYFKRNKKKYRVTVLSLFVSVVLFITASSLSTYFTDVIELEAGDDGYDIELSFYGDYQQKDLDSFMEKVKKLDAVDNAIVLNSTSKEALIPTDEVSKDFAEIRSDLIYSDYIIGYINFYCVEDSAFEALCQENGLNFSDFTDKNNPRCLMYDYQPYVNVDDNDKVTKGAYATFHDEKVPGTVTVYTPKDIKHYWFSHFDRVNNEIRFFYQATSEFDEKGNLIFDESTLPSDQQEISLSMQEAVIKQELNISKVLTEKPYFLPYASTAIIIPQSMETAGAFRSIEFDGVYVAKIMAEDHATAQKNIEDLLEETGLSYRCNVFNNAANMESMRALVTVGNVLAYGFIVLISLIAATNVFNTINTNIGLRRREFAMLKSIGMTKKDFWKMVCFESLLYGLKSLLFSIPVSVGTTYLIYRIVGSAGYNNMFYLPLGNFAIAIASVFIIVFLSMLYSMSKINKENTIEVLRQETT